MGDTEQFVVVEQVGAPPAAAPPAAAPPVIARELRNILGFAPSPDDLEGLQRALARSFDTVVEDGVTRVIYAPGRPGAPVEAVGLTGAQGSIYARARSALDDTLPILDQLEPMLEEIADDEAGEAMRAIVRSELTQIVDELGTEGGPNVPLIDGLWRQLVAAEPGEPLVPDDDQSPKPNEIKGHLGELRERFYYRRRYIANIADEENYTRFLTLVEHATSLHVSWLSHRRHFDGRRAYFGPLLVHLRRSLQTASDNVDELLMALDAVDIGHAERQLMQVQYERKSVYLQATMDWIKRFVAEEAPTLIDAAGKDGAIALHPTLSAMAEVVRKFIPPIPGFPTLYSKSPLVKAGVESLADGLDQAVEFVDDVRPAAVLSLLSPSAEQARVLGDEKIHRKLEDKNKDELKALAVKMGLDDSGTKSDMIERLLDAELE
jgi:hypothetical protein